MNNAAISSPTAPATLLSCPSRRAIEIIVNLFRLELWSDSKVAVKGIEEDAADRTEVTLAPLSGNTHVCGLIRLQSRQRMVSE